MGSRTRRTLLAGIALLGVPLSFASSPATSAAAADLDQCANGKPAAPQACVGAAWQNGNLNGSNSGYAEGESVPFRLQLSGLTAGEEYEVVLEHDTVHGAAHAYDYVTSYDHSETDADPCTGVLEPAACTAGAAGAPITRDPTLPAAVSFPAGEVVSVWNATAPTFSYVTTGGHSLGGASEKKSSFEVEFTATSTEALVAWGGHIALRSDWTPEDTAADVSGSPYHMRVLSLNGAGGNQDRSLKADAVLVDVGNLFVDKTGRATAHHGEVITYTISVTYFSDDATPADDVTVTDPACSSISAPTGDDSPADGRLDVDETWVYTCTATVPGHSATADPDPLPNTATATGDNAAGEPLDEASDDHQVDVVHDEGTLTIDKTGVDSAAHGASVTYDLAVSYEPGTDGSPATGIAVIDDRCTAAPAFVNGDDGDGLLEDGEVWLYRCTAVVPSHAAGEDGSVRNVATVDGTDLDGDALEQDTDDHVVSVVHDAGSLSIVKRADRAAVAHGGSVTYSFDVTYTPGADGAPAADVVVTDPRCTSSVSGPTGDDGDLLLEASETWVYECTLEVADHAAGEDDPITNTATVAGVDADGDPLGPAPSNEVVVDVLHGGSLAIDKSADRANADVGDTVVYTYLVTNLQGDAVGNVSVTDDKCAPVALVGGDADGDGKVDVGEEWRYTCSQVAAVVGTLTNVAVVTGTDALGQALVASDTATVSVARPVAVLGVQLPRTGADLVGWLELAAALLLLGFALRFAASRRRRA